MVPQSAHRAGNNAQEPLPDNRIVVSGMKFPAPSLIEILKSPKPPDTSYCGACSVFDAFVPTDYPAVPPQVSHTTSPDHQK